MIPLPNVDANLEEHIRQTAHHAGINAVERQLFGETTDMVEVSLLVLGREVRITTAKDTVRRVLEMLTGLDQ